MNKTNWRDGYVKGEKMPMYQLGIDVSKNTLDLCLLREGTPVVPVPRCLWAVHRVR